MGFPRIGLVSTTTRLPWARFPRWTTSTGSVNSAPIMVWERSPRNPVEPTLDTIQPSRRIRIMAFRRSDRQAIQTRGEHQPFPDAGRLHLGRQRATATREELGSDGRLHGYPRHPPAHAGLGMEHQQRSARGLLAGNAPL